MFDCLHLSGKQEDRKDIFLGLKPSGSVACVRLSALRLGCCRFYPWLCHAKAIKLGTQHLGLEFGSLDQTMIPKLLSVSPRVGGSNPEETFCIVWDVSISGIFLKKQMLPKPEKLKII